MTETLIGMTVILIGGLLALGLQIRKLEKDVEEIHAIQTALVTEFVKLSLKVEKNNG